MKYNLKYDYSVYNKHGLLFFCSYFFKENKKGSLMISPIKQVENPQSR